MKSVNGKEKYVLTTKLLVDKDGQKVGKTMGNALFMDSDPEKFFEGVMAFPDESVPLAYELLTEVSLEGIENRCKSDPYEEKLNLASEVVSFLWGQETSSRAMRVFVERRSEVKPSEEYSEYEISSRTLISSPTISSALSEVIPYYSTTQIKNLMSQGAIDYYDQNQKVMPITRTEDKDVNLVSEPGTIRVGSIDIRVKK
jgi:tyrosyl-tRNA synthetase